MGTRTHKSFLLTNYLLIGSSASCLFLTLSLRLIPSLIGLLVILLHAFTIATSVIACSSTTAKDGSSSSVRRHVAHMGATVLAAIVQGAVALLVLTRTGEFLWFLQSYVRPDNGVVIMRMVGILGAVVFCLEWVVLALAFAMRFYVNDDVGPRSGKVREGEEEVVKDWPWPFQV